MKKVLLSILSIISLNALSQWTLTSIYSTGEDCTTAFGKVLVADDASNTFQSSTDEGASWSTSATGVPASGLNFGTLNGTTLYAYDNNNIYESTNGTSWTLMTSSIPIAETIKSMCVINGTVLATASPSSANSKIYQLTGSSWVLKQSHPGVIFTVIRYLNGTLWAGTTNTLVMKSTNAGMTFAAGSGTLNPPGTSDKYVFCMAATSTALFFGNYTGKIMKSTDNGNSWSVAQSFPAGSTTFGISDIVVTSSNKILVACDSGFVFSSDNGMTWGKSNTGFSYQTWDLDYQLGKITTTANYIIVSAKNGKVFRRNLSQIFSGINENAFAIIESNVFPNPTSGYTTIQADDLMNEDNCSVRLHDVLGREIAEAEMHNGKANINADNYAKGLYTYTVYNKKQAVGKGKLLVN